MRQNNRLSRLVFLHGIVRKSVNINIDKIIDKYSKINIESII